VENLHQSLLADYTRLLEVAAKFVEPNCVRNFG